MIRCHLSRLMGERKMRIVEVAQAAQLNRSTVTALYYERAVRVELGAMERLCKALGCSVGELFEFVPQDGPEQKRTRH